MNINAAYSDPFAFVSAVKQQQVQQEVQTAVAVKAKAVQKAEGQAVLELLESAKGSASPKASLGMPGYAPHKGHAVDTYA